MPYRSLLDGDGPFHRPGALRQAFADAGIDVAGIDRPVVVYCNGGVSATAVANALALAGGPAAAVYDGSWNEWGNRCGHADRELTGDGPRGERVSPPATCTPPAGHVACALPGSDVDA